MLIADCKIGYFGDFCNEPCPLGFFGLKCGGKCFPGCTNKECNHILGCPKDAIATLKKEPSMRCLYA